MVTAWDLAGRQGYRRVPAVSERSSRAGRGCGVAFFLAPPHPPGRLLAWSTEIDRLGEAALEPVRPAVLDDLGRSKPAAPDAPFRIRHGPLVPLSYGVGIRGGMQ
jgi:hypothetical protein